MKNKNYPYYETTIIENFRSMVENVADKYPEKSGLAYKPSHKKSHECMGLLAFIAFVVVDNYFRVAACGTMEYKIYRGLRVIRRMRYSPSTRQGWKCISFSAFSREKVK